MRAGTIQKTNWKKVRLRGGSDVPGEHKQVRTQIIVEGREESTRGRKNGGTCAWEEG
jgi:hypothetical protein